MLRVLAPAKVNLGLWITGVENDGYHRIITLFYKIPLYDEILVEPWSSSLVRCEGLKSTSDNTVFKALKYLGDHVGRNLCLKITIRKRIPVGAGLGGGSSDAAAVLRVANRLFNLNLPLHELIEVGAKVGADVPFFLLPTRAAIGRGRGYDLEPLDLRLPGEWILVFPGVSVSTRRAYETFDREGTFTPPDEAERKVRRLVEAIRRGEFEGENDFEQVILPNFPLVREAKEELARRGWRALMSGSGSTVFGVGGGELPLLRRRFKVWHWHET
ncbi:MAG: 4-(cytidine 5'-diphospho)-2-C-methyl-D-erythritol kinase [Thermotogae bacterium]|nr:4-(cytidine 5'-diphospho)-2-C-methyl-D-erythritol kinase [Thermotogota bacterium]